MRTWDRDSKMFRGGGNVSDALLLLGQAVDDPPGRLLRDLYTVDSARKALLLPQGLEVPDGEECCRMRNFNNEATAGPFLRSFGIKSKCGLKRMLEQEMWRWYDGYGKGELRPEEMPYFGARVGFRSKLMEEKKAWEKAGDAAPLGRAVMMLDALEQVASSPLYNVMSKLTAQRRLERECGFKNGVVKASSDWGRIWEHVRTAKVIVELDWAKFDRERPREDIEFVIDVVLSCFEAKDERGRRLLEAYGLMMRRALVERLLVMDEGGIFGIEGMVPSGSLWTGWLDTALNILYIREVCMRVGVGSGFYAPMCAGDDNLTLFYIDVGDVHFRHIRVLLNEYFRAGIKEEDFFIHRPPFHVAKLQACFPPGTDLSHGTSKIIKGARWEEFEGELVIDEAAGKSHRWEYSFKGKPKFLSNFWLSDGQPVRPTHDNLEKLLWPEGIHKDYDDYQAAVLAMVVDNPWNHHNVNHMMMRHVIVEQLKRVSVLRGSADDVCYFASLRDKGGGVVPYPMVAPWRRGQLHTRMEDYPEVQRWIEDFTSFVQGVTSLYQRSCTGGLDSWQFMKIIRGESHVGEGQYGNDLLRWLHFIRENPCTKYLRAVRGERAQPRERKPEADIEEKARNAFMSMRDLLSRGTIRSTEDFCREMSSRLCRLDQSGR